MILVDTSAWIEFLRASSSPVHQQVRGLVASEAPIATTEPVVMEVLAGARDAAHLRSLRQLLVGCDLLPVDGLASWERAAGLWRLCRSKGESVRSLTDCLIADVTLRAGAAILHADRDYDAIARATGLAIA